MQVKKDKLFHPARYVRRVAMTGLMTLSSIGILPFLPATKAAAQTQDGAHRPAIEETLSHIERAKPPALLIDGTAAPAIDTAALLADKRALNNYLLAQTRKNITAARQAGRTVYSAYLDSIENVFNARIA